MTTEIEQMFQNDTDELQNKVEQLAVFCAVEDDEITKLQAELADRKQRLEEVKEDMANIMTQNGMESVKLANGLTPRATVKEKIFKQAGVTDDELFDWLKANELGDIIKPTVHFSAMQAALKAHKEQGGELPDELFNVSRRQSIMLCGKSKYIENRNLQVSRSKEQ